MEFENSAVSSRPRPWLLIALGVAVVIFAANWLWPTSSAVPSGPASSQTRAPQRRDRTAFDPADLDVRLDALNAAKPEAGSVERNPFRFQPKVALSPPTTGGTRPTAVINPVPPIDTGPPPPPPIPLKFIGIVEKQGLKVAALSDCRSTYFGAEGQIIDGRYRLIRIGVESMVIEYVDGRGRTTVRLEGCPPR
jgi:hypothetical protein